MKNFRLFSFNIIFLLLFSAACTKTIPIKSWSAPQDTNISASVDHIVVMNTQKNSLPDTILAESFREQLSATPFMGIEPSRDLNSLISQLKGFNFNPKIKNKHKAAYLSFTLTEDHDVNRFQNSRTVALQSCNYLRKKNPCWTAGTATIREGLQRVQYRQRVVINLKDASGTNIIPEKKIDRKYHANMRMVPDKLLLRKKVSELIVKEYLKNILPYRKHIEVELLSGDSIATEMIEKGAYNLALKRLEKLVNNGEKTPENIYLQGVIFEIGDDFSGAREFYNQARLLDEENEVILEAIARVEKITVIDKKTM